MKIYVENVMLGLSGLVFFGGGMMSDVTGQNLWFFAGLGMMLLTSFTYIAMQPYRWKNRVTKTTRKIPATRNSFPNLSRYIDNRIKLENTFVLNDSVLMLEELR